MNVCLSDKQPDASNYIVFLSTYILQNEKETEKGNLTKIDTPKSTEQSKSIIADSKDAAASTTSTIASTTVAVPVSGSSNNIKTEASTTTKEVKRYPLILTYHRIKLNHSLLRF